MWLYMTYHMIGITYTTRRLVIDLDLPTYGCPIYLTNVGKNKMALDMLIIYCHVRGYLDPTRGQGYLRKDLSSVEVDDIKGHMILLGTGVPICGNIFSNIGTSLEIDESSYIRHNTLHRALLAVCPNIEGTVGTHSPTCDGDTGIHITTKDHMCPVCDSHSNDAYLSFIDREGKIILECQHGGAITVIHRYYPP